MRPSNPFVWAAVFICLWARSLAGVKELRLPVPTSETIALVAREMGAATFEESVETDSELAETGRRVQRKLVTGVEDLGDNTEYQEYQGVMGRPGVDFPVLPTIPSTSFSCRAVRKPGYYADLDTDCQVFHICDGGRKISFLCPNGTIFRQSHLICDWWFRVDCGKSLELYEESAEQLAADQRIYKERAEAISRAMHQEDVVTSSLPPPSVSTNTRIDAPVFATAKQNYQNRKNARKQEENKFVRRQQTSETENTFLSDQNNNVKHLQYNTSEETRGLKPDFDEKEQQVLSETASFASSRGNRFGNQFFQAPFFSSSSQQNETVITNGASPNNINSFNQISTSDPSINNNYKSSTRQSPLSNVESYVVSTTSLPFRTSTPTPSVPPARNFRPQGRLLPTSSQNNNFRPISAQSNLLRNNRPSLDTNTGISTKQPILGVSQNSIGNQIGLSNPDISKNDFIKINSLQTPPPPPIQNTFARPSPELIPPEPRQIPTRNNNNDSGARKQALTVSTGQYNKNYIDFNNNRYSTSTTKRPLLSSPVSTLSSQTTAYSLEDNIAQQRLKQRRFSSTTQKPVFTVKFKPSKSFSYVELERTRTTPKPSTTPSIVQPTSTVQQEFSIPLDNQIQNSKSTKEPGSSVSFEISTSPKNRQRQLSVDIDEGEKSYTTEVSPENKYQTEWSPTRSQTGSNIPYNGSLSTTFNSTTSPGHPTSEITNNNFDGQQTTANLMSNSNEESRLNILTEFSNIDPAEINLLPSERKPKSRPDLIIPESSGPNALHTLALYYATSESDSNTTPVYTSPQPLKGSSQSRNENSVQHSNIYDSQKNVIVKQKSKVSDEILIRSHSGSPDNELEIDDVQSEVESADALKDLSTVLTKATKDSYSLLFNDTSNEHIHEGNQSCTDENLYEIETTKHTSSEKLLDLNSDEKNDLDSEQSRGIVQPTLQTKTEPTQTTRKMPNLFSPLDELPDVLKLRDSTDLRELAQVFSRALSAYLEDPDSFRRILSEVRPTEPTISNTLSPILSQDENEDEVLDFSDASITGPRLVPTSLNIPRNSEDSIIALNIEKINDLIRFENTTEPSQDVALPLDGAENADKFYTTTNPTSLAVDINFLSRNTNLKEDIKIEEESYFPTAGGVDDKSRPRYGGFHNNSATFDYKAYGSEVSQSVTGKPITETTYITEGPIYRTTSDGSGGRERSNNNISTVSSNRIEIKSIPDELGIVPAEVINSLVDKEDCNNSTHSNENDFLNESSSFKITNNKQPYIKEDNVYDNNSDEEKVLVASGSQSLVSRDNIVRLIGSKQNLDYKSNSQKYQTRNHLFTPTTETSIPSQSTTTVINRGHVRFGPPTSADRSDISSFRRKPIKEVTFQNVDLGNGVTLERTKTIRYTTPELSDIFRSTIPTLNTEEGINPLSINEQLAFVSEEFESTTKYSFTESLSSSNMKATTYHPSSSQQQDYPGVIPPRGSLRDYWQWNSETSNDLEIMKSLNNNPSTSPNGNNEFSLRDGKEYQSSSFSSFASTLLPPNVTMETAEKSILEQKAEEIFGKLNETSADMLMDVMDQAESNTTVRRLVLLLVADRNGREKKSFEESRAQLIQALLKTSEKMAQHTPSLEHTTEFQQERQIKKKSGRTRNRGKNTSTSSTTSSTTIKTNEERRSKMFRDTDLNVVTSSSVQGEPEPQYLRSPNLFPSNLSSTFGADPDARAVELLKSLYNLAARWG